MNVELRYSVGTTEYDSVVDKVYSKLRAQFEYELINSDKPLAVAKEQLEFFQAALFNKENKAIKKATFDQLFEATWSLERADEYLSELQAGNEAQLLNNSNTDVGLLGTLKGMMFYLNSLELTTSTLISNPNSRVVELPTLTKESILGFKSKIDSYKTAYLEWLKAGYRMALVDTTAISGLTTEMNFVSREKGEIEKLVNFDKSLDRAYITKRLDMSFNDVDALSECGVEIATGKYMEILQSFNHNKQLLAARFLAVKDYVRFLENETARVIYQSGGKVASSSSSADDVVRSFHWIDLLSRDGQLDKLYVLTTGVGLIGKDTNADTFVNAFIGIPLTEPLGIKWMIRTKDSKHTAKPSLFYFITSLIDRGLIQRPGSQDKDIQAVIQLVFADFKGKQLKSLPESWSTWKHSPSTPEGKSLIDEVLKQL